LVAAFQGDFYVDAAQVTRAIEGHSSFNLIHLETGFKVDLFVRGEHPFDLSEFERASSAILIEAPLFELRIKSPEDIILRKLLWFRLGGGISERQLADVRGVIEAQAERLDRGYLRRWIQELALAEILAVHLPDFELKVE
jgi:hypothetical protein